MFLTVYLILMLMLLALCLGLISRNQKVFQHSMDMINRIHAKALADINRGRDWSWRYDELDSVPYNTKLLKFWRPLSGFYAKDPAREDRF